MKKGGWDMSFDKIEFLWKIISRYDSYYNSINNKATVILAFNLFIFTGVITKYQELLPDYNNLKVCYYIITILILLIASSSLLSIWFTFRVINPYLNSYAEPTKYLSNIYFGHVCQHNNPENYLECVNKLEEKDSLEDLCLQSHSLAIGINDKFKNIRHSVFLILFFIIPAILLLIILKIIILNLN